MFLRHKDRRGDFARAIFATFLSLGLVCGICSAAPAPEEENEPNPETFSELNNRYRKGSWEWSVESAYLFHVFPNPWHSLIDLKFYDPNRNNYRFVTETFGLRYRLTDVEGPSFLRVSAQFCADAVVTEIVRGPENHFLGSAFGMHFDFVERGWPVVPYIDFRIGPGWIDASKGEHGQQSDFEFTYLWGGGLRYDINPSLSVSVGALDQHFSTGWLTGARNISVDNLGFNIRLEKKF